MLDGLLSGTGVWPRALCQPCRYSGAAAVRCRLEWAEVGERVGITTIISNAILDEGQEQKH